MQLCVEEQYKDVTSSPHASKPKVITALANAYVVVNKTTALHKILVQVSIEE